MGTTFRPLIPPQLLFLALLAAPACCPRQDESDPKLALAGKSPLSAYVSRKDGDLDPWVRENLSGITWNPDTETFFVVLNNDRQLLEFDGDLEHVRTLKIKVADSSKDLEDIVYLGRRGSEHEYALVNENGELLVGFIPEDDSATVDLDAFQKVVYAAPPPVANKGAEGVAFDAKTDTLWICNEKDPVAIRRFVRPTGRGDYRYDGSLKVEIPFDLEQSLKGRATDVSACAFDARTRRLLILSDESQKVLDVNLDGEVMGELEITGPKRQFEGLTVGPDGDLVLVSEPNLWRVYRDD